MTTSFVDSNLYDIVATAINTFLDNMNRLRGTKPDSILLETQAVELLTLSQVIAKEMPLKISTQYGFNTREWNSAIQELNQLNEQITDAIDHYQQYELTLVRRMYGKA